MISKGTASEVTTEPTPPEPRLRDIPDFVDNLLFCYECDDNAASSTVVDASGNVNAVLKRDAGDFAFDERNTEDETITGHIGEAFWGTQAGVNLSCCIDFTAVEDGVQGSIYHIARDFSWSMWVRWPTNTGVGANSRAALEALIGNFPSAGNYLQVMWFDAGGGDWRMQFAGYDGTFRGVYCNTDLSAYDDDFFHIAVSWNATAGAANIEDGMKIYINGSDDTIKFGNAGTQAGFDNTGWFYNIRPDAKYPARCDMDQFIGWSKTIDSTLASTIYNSGNGMEY